MPSQAESPTAYLDQHMLFQGLRLVSTTNVHAAVTEVTDLVFVSG